MSILLKTDIRGVGTAGQTVDIDAAQEADLVHRGAATYVQQKGLDIDPVVRAKIDLLTGGIGISAGGKKLPIFRNNSVARCVLIGDSRIEDTFNQLSGQRRDTYAFGHVNRLFARLGGRLVINSCLATGGKTLQNVIDEQLPVLLAMSPLPDYVYMQAGYNDANTGSTSDQMIARWETIYQAITGAGIVLLQDTSFPGNTLTASGKFHLDRYNRHIISRSGQRPGYYCADSVQYVIDPATGNLKSSYTRDGVHLTIAGANAEGDGLFSFFDHILKGNRKLLPSWNSPGVALVANPFGNGTGGTKGTGITGTSPDYWDINKAGAATATIAALTRADGVPGGLSVTVTAGTAGNTADRIEVEAGRPYFEAWGSGKAIAINKRVVPTVANGYQYLCLTAGSLASGSDPTATWSTTLGATFTDGTCTLQVVEAFSVGDTVVGAMEVIGGTIAGASGIRGTIQYYNSSFSVLQTVAINYMDSGMTAATNDGGVYRVLVSAPHQIPAGTYFANMRLIINAGAGDVVQVGRFCIEKI